MNISPQTDIADPVLEWTWHPMARKPLQGVLVLLLILCVIALVLYRLGGTAVSAALLVVFIFSLRDYLFPASCSLDPDGITVSSPLTGTRRVGWHEVVSHFQGARQLKLGLRSGKRLLLPPVAEEGLRLRVVAFITEHLDTDPGNG